VCSSAMNTAIEALFSPENWDDLLRGFVFGSYIKTYCFVSKRANIEQKYNDHIKDGEIFFLASCSRRKMTPKLG